MLYKCLFAALCLPLLALPAGAQPSGDLGWSSLRNDRGATVDFPGGLFSVEKSKSSGKVTYATADGRAQFEMFSVPNTRNDTPAEFARRRGNGEKLDYKRITARFIAASAIRDGRVLYRRCNFNRGTIHCIDLRYPASEERAWDRTVTRISLSLRPR